MLSFSKSSFSLTEKSSHSSITGSIRASSTLSKSEHWLLSEHRFDAYSRKDGRALRSLALFFSRLSNAPDLIRFSITPLFTTRESVLRKKSQKDWNFPSFSLDSIMFLTALCPTFATADSPSLIMSPDAEKSSFDSLISGVILNILLL